MSALRPAKTTPLAASSTLVWPAEAEEMRAKEATTVNRAPDAANNLRMAETSERGAQCLSGPNDPSRPSRSHDDQAPFRRLVVTQKPAWRREWDLNPRCPEAQRFSRPSVIVAALACESGHSVGGGSGI